MDELEGRALWARFKAAEPDPLTLAAYAENRLPPAEAEAVARWIAHDPELAADVEAARAQHAAVDDAAVERVRARARTLVSGQIITFRRRVTRWVEVAAIAASFALVAYVGFSLGAQEAAASTDDVIEIFDTFTGLNGGILEGLQA
jgi:anti-sigma factor RsiW